MRQLTIASVCSLLFLSGCVSLAPEYQRPPMPVPQQFSLSQQALTPVLDTYQDTGWRTFFPDATLQGLIREALENNRDLRMAVLKAEETLASLSATDAARYPQLNLTGNSTYQGGIDSEMGTTQNFKVGLGISYPLDFFGRLKNMTESARENYLASEASRRAVHILLVSQVAQAYFNQQRSYRKLQLAQDTLKNLEQSYRFVEQQLATGRATVLAIEQAKGQIDATRADLAAASGALAQANNALAILLGTYRTLPPPNTDVKNAIRPVTLPANLPSSILLQRPDIEQAEHALRAANANIGVARAAFFPNITLTSALSTGSNALSGLFGAGTGMWSFIPQLTQPLFNAGLNEANLQVAKLKQQEAVVTYEQKIQAAFKSVADALAMRTSLADQISAKERYLETLERTLDRARTLFAHGAVSYIEVLNAERTRFATQQSLVDLYYNQQVNEINLFTALGGGWIE